MKLPLEERKKIYEEEKARIEAAEKKTVKKTAKGGSTTSLKPNTAGLLCYVGFWVTGIIFLFLERKNKTIRFHAMQSLVAFGILNIIWGIANAVLQWSVWGGWGGLFYPQYIAATAVFGVFFAFWWILWGIAMYKVYHGQMFRMPVFADLADRCLAKLDGKK